MYKNIFIDKKIISLSNKILFLDRSIYLNDVTYLEHCQFFSSFESRSLW